MFLRLRLCWFCLCLLCLSACFPTIPSYECADDTDCLNGQHCVQSLCQARGDTGSSEQTTPDNAQENIQQQEWNVDGGESAHTERNVEAGGDREPVVVEEPSIQEEPVAPEKPVVPEPEVEKNTCPRGPQKELCNNLDDDCDGMIDNKPINPPPCAKQSGECVGARASRCVDGVWLPCRAAEYKKVYSKYQDVDDTCNNFDEDCEDGPDDDAVLCVRTYVGTGVLGTQSGAPVDAQFHYPVGITRRQRDGVIYVAEYGSSTIRRISKARYVSTIAGVPNKHSFQDGQGKNAWFRRPLYLTLNAKGNELYISDYANHRIRKLDLNTLDVSTFVGDGKNGRTDGNGTGASISFPAGLAFDNVGNLYFAEHHSHTIRKVTPKKDVTLYAGGFGRLGQTVGSLTQARFEHPLDVKFLRGKGLYVTSYYYDLVRNISPSGQVSILAGSSNGYSDGKGKAARFHDPYSIALDGVGNMYIADRFNHCIRKMDTAGYVTTIAGTQAPGYLNGAAKTAQFSQPVGLAFDPVKGHLYISDYANHRIRRMKVQ